jgi:hypothetical protein
VDVIAEDWMCGIPHIPNTTNGDNTKIVNSTETTPTISIPTMLRQVIKITTKRDTKNLAAGFNSPEYQ